MIASALVMGIIAGGALPGLAPAEKIDVTGTVSAGSGLSVAGAGGTALARRSPFFIVAEVGLTHPQVPWVEFSPGIMFEAEGRISFGVLPKVRLFLPGRRFRGYGIVAVPVVVVPFTLVGAQVGAGLEFRLHRRMSVVAEGTANAFVLGSDLMEGSALGKFDVTAGIRVYF